LQARTADASRRRKGLDCDLLDTVGVSDVTVVMVVAAEHNGGFDNFQEETRSVASQKILIAGAHTLSDLASRLAKWTTAQPLFAVERHVRDEDGRVWSV
jgi:hypothetical protein